jgi:hypothetical protein
LGKWRPTRAAAGGHHPRGRKGLSGNGFPSATNALVSVFLTAGSCLASTSDLLTEGWGEDPLPEGREKAGKGGHFRTQRRIGPSIRSVKGAGEPLESASRRHHVPGAEPWKGGGW